MAVTGKFDPLVAIYERKPTMTDPQTGYKVLKKDNDKLYSCCLPEGLRMEYPVGEEVTPHEGWGPLALFPDEVDSYSFIAANNLTNCTARECEYQVADFGKYKIIVDEEGTNRPARVLYMPRGTANRYMNYFARRIYRGNRAYAPSVPATTIYAGAVKVLPLD